MTGTLTLVFLSAVIAAGLLYIIVPYESHGLLGVTQMKPVESLVGFGVELLMTFIVTLIVLTCTDGGHRVVDHSASMVIGLAVTACHLFGVIVNNVIWHLINSAANCSEIYRKCLGPTLII